MARQTIWIIKHEDDTYNVEIGDVKLMNITQVNKMVNVKNKYYNLYARVGDALVLSVKITKGQPFRFLGCEPEIAENGSFLLGEVA